MEKMYMERMDLIQKSMKKQHKRKRARVVDEVVACEENEQASKISRLEEEKEVLREQVEELRKEIALQQKKSTSHQ